MQKFVSYVWNTLINLFKKNSKEDLDRGNDESYLYSCLDEREKYLSNVILDSVEEFINRDDLESSIDIHFDEGICKNLSLFIQLFKHKDKLLDPFKVSLLSSVSSKYSYPPMSFKRAFADYIYLKLCRSSYLWDRPYKVYYHNEYLEQEGVQESVLIID